MARRIGSNVPDAVSVRGGAVFSSLASEWADVRSLVVGSVTAFVVLGLLLLGVAGSRRARPATEADPSVSTSKRSAR